MCNLWTSYAVAVQLCLGLSIILVLVVEYVVERCRKPFPRTFVQFWFDSFKLCCGAMVTHGFNVLCASILGSANADVDECAVYMIAFYYEATGITFVQMLQYGLVKYARRKYLEIYYHNSQRPSTCSNIWYWISYPGHYTFQDKPLESARKLLSDTDSPPPNRQYGATNADDASINNKAQSRTHHRQKSDDELLREELGDVINPEHYKYVSNQSDIDYNGMLIGNITFLHTRLASTRNKILCVLFSIVGAVGAGFLSYFVLDYHSMWIDVMLAVCAMIMCATLSVATAPVIWQSASWVMIKFVERSLWTLFVYSQMQSFVEYAQLIAFSDDVMEAILYIAIIPMIIGMVMFWMFSNIARMNIPFIDVKKFASNVMARFDLKEALKVGVYSTLLYNSILWLPAELAILSWESAGMLFLMMVIVPAVANAICVLFLYLLLSDIDDNASFMKDRHNREEESGSIGGIVSSSEERSENKKSPLLSQHEKEIANNL
eukprot:464279_1